MMRASVTLVVLLLSGCAPLYPVQIAQTAPNTYIATQESASAWLDARAAAIQRAGKFCQKQGRVIHVTSQSQQRTANAFASNDHASIEFQCLPPPAAAAPQ
jgi:hypothetical protein